nr:hypothetical protein [Tanacetum cinerariifolium]
GAVLVYQHHERAVVLHPRVFVEQHLGAAAAILHLHHRATRHKQAGHCDSIAERAASIFAQVEDDALHAFGRELGQFLAHVVGRRAPTGAGEVSVKYRQAEVSDF